MTAADIAHDDVYAITPADMRSCRAWHSAATGDTVHLVLTAALTTYCGAIPGRDVDGEVTCVKCLARWSSATPEGSSALVEALARFRGQR